MDFVTGLPKSVSGLDAILVMVDKRTKMAHFAACKTTCDAEQTAQLFVHNIVRLHGMPLKILMDRGPQFTSKFTEAVLRIMGTRQALSTAYHPQTDGQTERLNAIMEDMLRHYVSADQNDWDQHLDMAEFAVNSAEHESTHKSPFELNYGFLPRTPTSLGVSAIPTANAFVNLISKLLMEARIAMRNASIWMKRYYDKTHKFAEFKKGDWVLLNAKNLTFKVGSPKLLPRWVGPFEIEKPIGKVAYKLHILAKWRLHDVFHVSLLAEYRRDGIVQPPPAELLSGELEYEVAAMLQHKDTPRSAPGKFTRQYLVMWRGSDSGHNTWEPARNLMNAAHKVREYWEQQGLTQIPKKIILNTQVPTVLTAGPDTLVNAIHAVKDAPISKSKKRRNRKKLIGFSLADLQT